MNEWKYKVKIKNNETGESVWHEEICEWHESSMFWWTEGNMSCDCNRELCFLRAKDLETEDSFDNTKCGDSKYSIESIQLKDGTLIEVGEE